MIDGVLQLLVQRYLNKQVVVKRRYDWTGELEADVAVLHQVFWNVLENAFEAISTDREVVIHVVQAGAYYGKRRKGIRVTVADNGPGISVSEMKKVFEPFYSTKIERGRGLGLWVVQDLLTRREGTIRVKSSTSHGKSGTVCSIFLPFKSTVQSNAA